MLGLALVLRYTPRMGPSDGRWIPAHVWCWWRSRWNVNSPVTCIQPSTPQNPSSVQPGSVGPGSQQPGSVQSQEENTKEYNDLVESLKEQYYEKLKRIGDRCDLDNSPKPTGFDRLMEILDRKRKVSQSLLEKIVGNVRTIVERSSLTYPVIETLRQIEAEGQSSIFSSFAGDDHRASSQGTPQAVWIRGDRFGT